ncbi:tetraacyldisaccharide 4'-kinase [Synechococcus sp. GFB01]|uniref:tetraacyldisaccharide 4'-kinase n=1 Tax=Synechococcus sp. GFB01 TaxID=1662190 RepID=UPI0009EB546B|nr:tetraacyldisaccharide 4'-kinase [Synechococcus sp. GFB01]
MLDDGLQHWRLARDCDISVLDGRHGLGNGLVFPAGPLREPADQLGRADLLVLTGPAASELAVPPPLWPAGKPWFRLAGWIEPPARLIGVPLLAFCGIGLPAKFFAALRQAGLELAAAAGFPDHHPYAASDLERLQRRADIHGATLVTTVKDWQRLPDGWREKVVALPLVLDSRMVEAITSAALARMAPRRLEIPE